MKISVVIPLYNKRETVLRALISVINQTVLPEEIIVVNDGSTDGSEQLIAELNHPLVRLIFQPNAGVSAARNRGINEAKGDYIAFLDADDSWLPGYLGMIIALLKKYPESSVLATAYFLEDFRGTRKNIILKKLPFRQVDGILSNYFEVASCSHPPLCSSAIAVKKTVLVSIGGFPAGVKSGEDLLIWARLAVNQKIAYSINPLSVFVQGAAHTYDEKPNRIPHEPDLVGEELKAIARQHKNIKGIRKYLANWFKMRSSIYLRLGMRRKSFDDAVRSLSNNPLNYKVFIYLILILMPSGFINRIFRKIGHS
jgi:glycosyltransferase involved in cell wall biosynthesis